MNAAADRIRELVTPEGVALHLRLAEVSERLCAFLLDLAVICALLVGLTIVSAALLRGTGIELAGIVWLLGFFLLRNFYFALFELQPRAATPGKRMIGIRVATQSGGRLTVDAILARNLVRELELFLPLSLLGLQGRSAGGWLVLLGLGWVGVFTLFPLFNRDRLRVGDLLAGTWVVGVPRRRLLADLALAPPGSAGALAFTAAQLGAYGIKELHVLEDVLRAQSPATLAAVAGRIAGKIGWTRGSETDLAFLQAFYAGLRARLERGLLFGQRRRDKFDSDVRRVTRTRPPTGSAGHRP